ncbi:hypothetical protein ACLOJK_033351 [Asimina triloba]
MVGPKDTPMELVLEQTYDGKAGRGHGIGREISECNISSIHEGEELLDLSQSMLDSHGVNALCRCATTPIKIVVPIIHGSQLESCELGV